MWQDILVYLILAVVTAVTLWRFFAKFTGKAPCCGGGCTCKGSCSGSSGSHKPDAKGNASPFARNPHHSGCGCGH